MFEIEKNVPVEMPENRGRKRLYPFPDMEIGDSFFAEGKTIELLTTNASIYGTRHGKKFSCKSTESMGQKGVRVWRIA
jgi:hypothetical protein